MNSAIATLAGVPHLDQYFGTWAMEPEHFNQLFQVATKLDLHVHLQQQQQARAGEIVAAEPGAYEVRSGVAMIGLYGMLMKQSASFTRSTSTVETRRKVRRAAADPDVSAILIHIESPGGTVAGNRELADDIAAAARKKPVWSYIEDLGASAAYWNAAQASRIFTNAAGMVGSIGTYMVVNDSSEAAKKDGIRAHVIRAGSFKGAGTPGTEITEAHLAEYQRIVDTLNQQFLEGVASGRRMPLERVKELADGRIHVGAAALALNLVDGVEALDTVFANLVAETMKKGKGKAMSIVQSTSEALTANATANAGAPQSAATSPITSEAAPAATAAAPAKPKPATLAELKAACPGASPAFILGQIEAEATVAQAMTAHSAELQAQLRAKDEQLARLQQNTAPAPQPKRPGVSAVGGAGSGDQPVSFSGDAKAEFDKLVDDRMKATGCTKNKAHEWVCQNHDDVRAAMVAQFNAGRKAK